LFCDFFLFLSAVAEDKANDDQNGMGDNLHNAKIKDSTPPDDCVRIRTSLGSGMKGSNYKRLLNILINNRTGDLSLIQSNRKGYHVHHDPHLHECKKKPAVWLATEN
jgi:hypothetical protein